MPRPGRQPVGAMFGDQAVDIPQVAQAARQIGFWRDEIARVFERGEGPTASSGTSACAVACAAWRAGWVAGGEVAVVMPGGTVPVRLQIQDATVLSVSLFGAARPQLDAGPRG